MLLLVDVIKRTTAYLDERGVPQPRLETELLLGKALGMSRVTLYLESERPLTQAELDTIRPLVARRGKREPLHWILGSRGFHDIELQLRPGVLVPRPDTEALVEAVLQRLPEAREDQPLFVADVGCGSGAVGLALAHARPDLRVYCTDVDETALSCTRDNVAALELGQRVAVLEGSLLSPIPPSRPVDWVASNPPYIPSRDLEGLEPEVRDWEPRRALDGGPDGLAIYRALIPAAAARARLGVAVEIGHDQAAAVSRLFEQAGLAEVTVVDDLGGNARVVLGLRPRSG